MSIRALIVDDEPLARERIRMLLTDEPQIEIVAESANGTEALRDIQRLTPDLVFLDVQMPELTGFEVLYRLEQTRMPVIIFVTAYDQYALKAFEAGALDYLLKPFDNARFVHALSRAKERVLQNKKSPAKTDRFMIKSTGQISFVKIAEIDWIEAADYYACLHVGAKSHLLRRRMSELERELDGETFCRVHRSSIVNLNRVRGLEMNAEGDFEVVLDGGRKLRLSRRYRKQLQSRLGDS